MGGYCYELCKWILWDPAKLIRYLVLFVCCVIVIVQLTECLEKLKNPPISTHSYYNLNETIEMPALTICRDPPYKSDILSDLSNNDCIHPKYSTCWTNYSFNEISLTDFFMNSTYDESETFLGEQYGLNGYKENVKITSSLNFYQGRCFTVRPNILSKRVNRNAGYSMILKHHVNPENRSYNEFERQPGWHIFIHDQKEDFTEINMKASGRVEYVFAEINEELEIKLQTNYFSNIERRDRSCSRIANYSNLKCGELCVWNKVTEIANCSGPWIDDVRLPYCDNKKSMKKLTAEYSKYYSNEKEPDCDCIEPCESRLFSSYIQNRKNFLQPEPSTQLYIYYTTKLISMIEEKHSYDTTQFIADIGGSLGFLLGLSVLGIIGILEHLILFLCGGFVRQIQKKDERLPKPEVDNKSQRSDETVDVAIISERKFQKNEECIKQNFNYC